MTEISFSAICKALKEAKLPPCELVIGIANGGVVPAALVASRIGSDLRIIRLNYRNEENIPRHPKPVLLDSFTLPKKVSSILLVDDVTVSCKTIKAAKKLLNKQKVRTLVLRGRADYVLFPNLSRCIKWPWAV